MKKVLMVLVIVFVLIIALKVAIKLNNKQSSLSSTQTIVNQEYSPEIFQAINKLRVEQGMPVLTLDNNLCAYAKRRALQYKDQGEAATKIFQTDGNNTEIMNTYFKDFGYTQESMKKAGLVSDEQTAKDLGTGKLSITHGCVASAPSTDGTGTWEVFIGATKK